MAFRPDSTHELSAGHPRLFRLPPLMTSYLPAGWLTLARGLANEIEELLPVDAPVRVAVVEEKMGRLRFSIAASAPEPTMARIRELVSDAEEASTSVCAKCGAPG